MSRCLGSLALLSVCFVLTARQGDAQIWAWTYGAAADDTSAAVQETTDGGVVIAGATTSFGAAEADVWVVKLDAYGMVSWERRYGGAGTDRASSIDQTSDGGFVVAGRTDSFGAGGTDAWLLRLDADGVVVWEKRYGGPQSDWAAHVRQTSPDGGYIVVGGTESFGAVNTDLWALKLDPAGTVEWQYRYGGSSIESGAHVEPTGGSGYVVMGNTSAANGDYWIVKLDADGTVDWQRSYGMRTFVAPSTYNDNTDVGGQVLPTSDDGYLLIGESHPVPAGNSFGWVVKTDAAGVVSWQRMYSRAGNCLSLSSGVETVGGSYAVVGACDGESWMVGLDGSGTVLWANRYGSLGTSDSDVLRSIANVSGGGFIAAGDSSSFGEGGLDLWVLKLSELGGLAGCAAIDELTVVGEDTAETPAVIAEPATATDVPVSGVATAATTAGTDSVRRDGCARDEHIDLPTTGQTTVYGAGDDGDLRMGAAWPDPRFEDNGDGTLTDTLTGIVWLQDADCAETIGHDPDGYGPGRMTWTSAFDFVAGINDGTHASCGAGRTDWRVPNVVELESLVNLQHLDQSAWLAGQGFSNVSSEDYWTSNRSASTGWMSWIVRMLDGTVTRWGADGPKAVWPARAGQRNYEDPAFSANPWKTGEQTSYYPGDDGDLQMGVVWPDPRFTDNGDGTVTDNLTGLVWLQDTACLVSAGWQDALDAVAAFDVDPGSFGCAGYSTPDHVTGWRVPNRKELLSLLDFSTYLPVLPPGHPFLNVTVSNVFWTSSTYADSSTSSPAGWVVYALNTGALVTFLKSHTQPNVWPVRGGISSLDLIFRDEFEIGNTSAWSSAVP